MIYTIYNLYENCRVKNDLEKIIKIVTPNHLTVITFLMNEESTIIYKHFDKLTKNVFRLIQENSETYSIQAICNSTMQENRGALLFEFESIMDALITNGKNRITFVPEEQWYAPEFASLIEGYIRRYNPLQEFVAVCIFNDHPNHAIRAEIIQREKEDKTTDGNNHKIWNPNQCYHCLKENKNNLNDEEQSFYHCYGCAIVPYCSLTCQKMDWFHGNHRSLCNYLNKINKNDFHYPIPI